MVTMTDYEAGYGAESGILLVKPEDNFPFMLSATTKEKSKEAQK